MMHSADMDIRPGLTHTMSNKVSSFNQLMPGGSPCLSRPLAAHSSSTRLPSVVITSFGVSMNCGADPSDTAAASHTQSSTDHPATNVSFSQTYCTSVSCYNGNKSFSNTVPQYTFTTGSACKRMIASV